MPPTYMIDALLQSVNAVCDHKRFTVVKILRDFDEGVLHLVLTGCVIRDELSLMGVFQIIRQYDLVALFPNFDIGNFYKIYNCLMYERSKCIVRWEVQRVEFFGHTLLEIDDDAD